MTLPNRSTTLRGVPPPYPIACLTVFGSLDTTPLVLPNKPFVFLLVVPSSQSHCGSAAFLQTELCRNCVKVKKIVLRKGRGKQAATDQTIRNLERENALIASAWYDLTSRLQSNHVVLQRRNEAPKSWLNKQRHLVNGERPPPFGPLPVVIGAAGLPE